MNRSKLALAPFVGLALIGAVPAVADVTVSATCMDGTVSCTVGIFASDDDWQGVVLQWRYLNVCDDPWRPVEMEPLPMPPFYEEHSLPMPAHDPDEWVEYAGFYLDADGGLHQAYGPPWAVASAEVTCANPILVRGYLQEAPGVFWVEPCPETCWLWESLVFTMDLEPGTWEHLVNSGIPVNIWGHYRRDQMPGGSGVWASAIAPAGPGEDCGPAVGSESASWGSIKSLYR